MILTVTANPALDHTWHVSRLLPGESHRVETGVFRAGGKGLNVARVLHAQHHDVLALATVGGATGREFAAELAGSGIPHLLVPVEGATRRSVAVVDSATGAATVLNERGASLSNDELEALADVVLAQAARVVAISGSLPPGMDPGFLGRLVAALRVAGARVIVDTSGPGILAAARGGADILKPNLEELVQATGLSDPVAGARVLLDAGAHRVAVSAGAEGLILVAPDSVVRARLPEALRTGNPTGAGDALVASLAAHLHDHAELSDLDAVARRAVAWSAAAVLAPVAGELHPSHYELHARVLVTADSKDPR